MDGIYAVMDFLLPFDWAEFNFMKNALLAVLMLTPIMGLMGTMVVNNKLSFFSDALGHSALTGIGIGVLLGIDNYMISMVGFALLFALCITGIIQSDTASADTIIGVFSAVGVALGVVLLSANGGFTKYSNYLIGDILAITQTELLMLAIVLIATVVLWVLIFNKLMLASVNSDLASSKRVKVRLYNNIFVVMIALLVTISIKWVGIMIINSLLILPAAAGRNISSSMRSYHVSSVLFSIFSGVTGLICSYYFGTSAGGTIVLAAAVIYFITFFIGRKRKA